MMHRMFAVALLVVDHAKLTALASQVEIILIHKDAKGFEVCPARSLRGQDWGVPKKSRF